MKLRDIDVKLEEPFEQQQKKVKKLKSIYTCQIVSSVKIVNRGIGRTKLFITLKISLGLGYLLFYWWFVISRILSSISANEISSSKIKIILRES